MKTDDVAEPAPDNAVTASPSPPAESPDGLFLVPRGETQRDGQLLAANTWPVDRADLHSRLLAPIIDLVRLATLWPMASEEVEGRIGDYRFLVLEFNPTEDILAYVQIWSEPQNELFMEVGPGERTDAALQAFADRIAPALAGRGFAIGGGARNFEKRLPAPASSDTERIAHELLSLLLDVLGYDGTRSLTYQLHQDTHMGAAFITRGIAPSGLSDLLKVWGLHAVPLAGDPSVLEAKSHGIDFQVQFFVPLQGKKATFWEFHLLTQLPVPRDRVPELLREVNDTPRLLKAWALADNREPTIPVRLAYGINLAGGVPLEHIKCQIFEWLDSVKALWTQWRTPLPDPETATIEVTGHTVH